jgi:hypothetical protein
MGNAGRHIDSPSVPLTFFQVRLLAHGILKILITQDRNDNLINSTIQGSG